MEQEIKDKWEFYFDESYYGLWAVRPIGDKDFNSQTLSHVHSKEEAEALKSLLESISPINGVEEKINVAEAAWNACDKACTESLNMLDGNFDCDKFNKAKEQYLQSLI